mgnify:CR=1 FL=1
MPRRSDEQEAERAARMQAAQRGDVEAYELLLASLLAPLRGFVRRRGVDDATVEDVVQEILILLHRARHPWLWSIARNATTDALRRQSRERARSDASGSETVERTAADPEGEARWDPELRLTSHEVPERMAEALRLLPATQRQAVELLYVEQLPVAEAAARAGVSPGALKVRAHRGSRALRSALSDEKKR